MDVAQIFVKQRLRSSFGSPCSTDTGEQQPACLFCGDTKGDFNNAETLPFDVRVRDMETDLRDTNYFQVYRLAILWLYNQSTTSPYVNTQNLLNS